MTSQWDAFTRRFHSLIDGRETNKGKAQDIIEAVSQLIESLHDYDHATDHKSTLEIFKRGGLQKIFDRMECDHHDPNKACW